MDRNVRYPVGQQSFESLREGGYLYVDKTRFIEKIVTRSQFYFLGRPRRFGKSLFLSTLKCFFQGKRHLFKGLYADSMEWDWEPYPVLYLDLNIEKYHTPETLDEVVRNSLTEWEAEYDVVPIIDNLSIRFRNIIKAAYEKTGRKVVILVDEYDKPLVGNLHGERTDFEFSRDRLAAIYSNFKSSSDYIRLVFLTGVSRFAHLSVFSGLNNINDISFDNRYSDICGISEEELQTYFQEGIHSLAESYGVSEDDICHDLKRNYDGYRFSSRGKDMYNPFSILNVMENGDFRNYWIQSGQPTLLQEQLKRFYVDLSSLFNTKCDLDELQGLDLDNPRPVALLYQTGYLTIKDYYDGIYTLGMPNREVTRGFLQYLLPFYANIHNENSRFFIYEFVRELREGNVEGFMKRMQGMFSSVSYDMEMGREQNLHNAMLILVKLLGLDVETEYRTSNGRIDLYIRTGRYNYIIELKLDGSAQEALDQINEKGYCTPFATDYRKLIKIGINFSSQSRTITDWLQE